MQLWDPTIASDEVERLGEYIKADMRVLASSGNASVVLGSNYAETRHYRPRLGWLS